jgi:hypothetical protein
MHRRTFLMSLVGLGAAVTGAVMAGGAAQAAMPVTPAPAPEPKATTAEVQPGRDVVPMAEEARFRVRRRVVVRRRRRVFPNSGGVLMPRRRRF